MIIQISMSIKRSILVFLKFVHPAEIICGVAAVTALNILNFSHDPGFMQNSYNPYFFVILLFSTFYGKISGFITYLLSIMGIIASTIYIYNFNHKGVFTYKVFTVNWLDSFLLFISFAFISTIIFGEIRDTFSVIIHKLKTRNKELQTANGKLHDEIEAISTVNDEYQDRILGQQNSLISLYSIMISLNSLDLKGIYPNVVQAVVKFSGATKCSIWKYEQDDRRIKLLSTHGWTADEIKENSELSDEATIIGWVARNNVMFSIKMLTKYKNLREIDTKKNVITVPITIEKRVWGIINIEQMPFIKYNLYSEQLILMISDLAAPVIANAIRFTQLTKRGDIDPVTGFHSFDELNIVLKDEFEKFQGNKLVSSFIILELSNYADLLEQYPENDVLGVLKKIAEIVTQVSFGKAMIFQYKETFQFAVVVPNMDHDGAAMFCLSVIEEHFNKQFQIKNENIQSEIIMGYSSMRENHRNEEDLMVLAENLIMMQKI